MFQVQNTEIHVYTKYKYSDSIHLRRGFKMCLATILQTWTLGPAPVFKQMRSLKATNNVVYSLTNPQEWALLSDANDQGLHLVWLSHLCTQTKASHIFNAFFFTW